MRVFLCAAAVLSGLLIQQDRPKSAFAAEHLLVVPAEVHLLQSPHSRSVGTTLHEKDVARIISKANRIWHQAGIVLDVTAVTKPAAVSDTMLPDAPLASGSVRVLRPKETRTEGTLHIFFVRSMDVNGIYTGRDGIFVQQEARLREVEGGIDEPLPRITSHEIGHALGLRHRQDRTNLMASGTTGTLLNEEEIATARAVAKGWKETLPLARYLEEAESSPDKPNSLRRLRLVAETAEPGPLRSRALAALRKAGGQADAVP
jgi:hypothetical protein